MIFVGGIPVPCSARNEGGKCPPRDSGDERPDCQHPQQQTEKSMEDISIDKIVGAYIKIRDTKDALYQKYKAETSELEEQMQILKHKLVEVSKETGVTSFSTPHGTAYRTVKNRYWTNDWEQFYKFMREHEAMELLEKRIQQSNMKEFLEQNPDVHPPGLNIDSEYEITIRRK
jgi:hypothetical protein